MNVSGVSWWSREVWGRWGSLLFVVGWILASISVLPVIYGFVDPSGPYLGTGSPWFFAVLTVIGVLFIGLASYRANRRYHDLREGSGGSPMHPGDTKPLVAAGRRFFWLYWTLFAALVVGLLAAHWLLPTVMGPLSDFRLSYIITISIIGALTFGGLYAAASALRPKES